jgi:hypothetical protein
MVLIDEVVSFARSYINKRSYRTEERKAKIKEALLQLTGEKLNFGCSTCYIEALFKILNYQKMATPKGYELKKGVLLQAFGDASKTCTNLTLTDELAEWYLKHYPEKAVLFARIPGGINTVTPPAIRIIPPNIVKPENIIIPPDKIAKEDPIKRKELVDKALELGFKTAPENPIENISSDELSVIITNLEKAKEATPPKPKTVKKATPKGKK